MCRLTRDKGCHLESLNVTNVAVTFSVLSGSVKTIFEEELGVVDFCLSNKTCVLYVSESDLVAGNDYRRKIVWFRNVNH